MLESVHTTGQATWSDDQLLVLQRRGYPEECYFTFSYSPVEDDAGKVCGIFSALTETTERVLAGRRAQVAQELAAGLAEAYSTESVAQQALAVLAVLRLWMYPALLCIASKTTDRPLLG